MSEEAGMRFPLDPKQIPISKVKGLEAALDGKAPQPHTHVPADMPHAHPQSEVTGLTAALAAKSNDPHSHAQSDVTGLAASLASKAPTSHAHAESDVTGLVSDLAGKAAVSHTHVTGNITGLDATLAQLSAWARVKYAKTGLLTNSSGVLAVTMPQAGLALSVLPRTTGEFAYNVAWSGLVATFTFRKFKSGGLGITLGTLLSVEAFEPSPGVVTFDIIGVEPTP